VRYRQEVVSRSQTALFLFLGTGKKRVWYTYVKNSVHRNQGDTWLLLIDESFYFIHLQIKRWYNFGPPAIIDLALSSM